MGILSLDRLCDALFYTGNIIVIVFGDYAELIHYGLRLGNMVM